MKRSPLAPGNGFKPPTQPLARGTARLVSTKPMQRTVGIKQGGQLARPTKPMAPIGQRAKHMRQGKVKPNAAEQAWLDAVSQFGCIVCYLFHNARTPCAVHHPLAGGRRMGHLYAIGLCDPGHHQNSPTPEKISRHPDKAKFEAAYGTEKELLEQLRTLLIGRAG